MLTKTPAKTKGPVGPLFSLCDGQGAVRQLQRIATGLRLREVAPPTVVITQAQTPAAILAPKDIAAADLERCREVGAVLAAGLAAGVF